MKGPTLNAYNHRLGYLIMAIISLGLPLYFLLGPFEKTRSVLHPVKFVSIIAILFIFGIPTYFFYGYFNRQAKLSINDEGITLKSKHFIPWSDVWYFYFELRKHDDNSSYLTVKPKEKEDEEIKSITIPIDNLSENRNEIESILQHYKSIHGFLQMDDLVNPQY